MKLFSKASKKEKTLLRTVSAVGNLAFWSYFLETWVLGCGDPIIDHHKNKIESQAIFSVIESKKSFTQKNSQNLPQIIIQQQHFRSKILKIIYKETKNLPVSSDK